MEEAKKSTGIGVATLIIIFAYSIVLYIYFENTIPGIGIGLSMAQELFMSQLVYIIPIGLIGIGLIFKENIEIKVKDFLAISSTEKIRNYFSDRIEEIEEGNYVPIYKQIKKLPEFSEINRVSFRTARRKWYLYNFGMPYFKFNTQIEKSK